MRSAALLIMLAGLLGVARVARAQQGPPPGQGVVPAGAHAHGSASCSTKVCAVEMKPTTKTVYGSACKDYCRSSSCCDFIRSCFGLKCSDHDCGTVHTYKVLMKKTVPGPGVPVCRVKDLAAPAHELGTPTPISNPKSK